MSSFSYTVRYHFHSFKKFDLSHFLLLVKPKAQITLNNLNDKSNVQIKNGKNLFKVIENTNQTLTCNSMSNPKLLAVEWYKNGHLFSKFAVFRIKKLNFHSYNFKKISIFKYYSFEKSKFTNKLNS